MFTRTGRGVPKISFFRTALKMAIQQYIVADTTVNMA